MKEISKLLNTGLDDETLKVCVQLLEAGVNPEALATVVLELRKETAALKVKDQVIYTVKIIMQDMMLHDPHRRLTNQDRV